MAYVAMTAPAAMPTRPPLRTEALVEGVSVRLMKVLLGWVWCVGKLRWGARAVKPPARRRVLGSCGWLVVEEVLGVAPEPGGGHGGGAPVAVTSKRLLDL